MIDMSLVMQDPTMAMLTSLRSLADTACMARSHHSLCMMLLRPEEISEHGCTISMGGQGLKVMQLLLGLQLQRLVCTHWHHSLSEC